MLSFVAENITSNVRQIEGVVNKIMAIQELTGAKGNKKLRKMFGKNVKF